MSTPDQIKVTHGLLLMSRFDRMKERELICDFTIKVGSKSFPVHRAVLVASSDYFEGMFSSNMKEVREGCVDMKNLGANAIGRAIEFMYTGSAKVTMESVQDILHVAELFQLDGLKNLCFQFLLDNLSPNNCLSVINLAQTYNRQDIKEEAERVVVTDFDAVIFSEMFPLISRSDFLRYISNVGYETSWKAAITWAKDKEEFPQLIESMGVNKFPFKFLLETVLKEPLLKKESTRNLVNGALFSNAENLRKNLDTGNCFHLKNLAKKHDAEDAINGVIDEFMQTNFQKIFTKPEFCKISKDDIIALFQSPASKYSSETVKWEAAVKWVKHDIQDRKNTFPELFSLIKLEDISLVFLRHSVRNESLVKESRKCSDVLIDVLFSRAAEREKEKPGKEDKKTHVCDTNTASPVVEDVPKDDVIVIDRQPPGEIHFFRLDHYFVEIMYSLEAGHLQGILSYPSQEFRAYFPAADLLGVHQIYERLKRAFRAGQVFKLEHREGQQQGRIVWGDVPHKTSKSGGPQNNGYPDPGYTQRIDEALKSKGF